MAVLQQLAYGLPVDATDIYVDISESTANESMLHLCRAVMGIFGTEYLHAPTPDNLKRKVSMNTEREFFGMLESLDFIY